MKSNSMATSKFLLCITFIFAAEFAIGGEQDKYSQNSGTKDSAERTLTNVQSDEYSLCVENAMGVHVQIMTCMDNEIDRRNAEIESQLSTAKKDPSIKELWAALNESRKAWITYSYKKCDLYQHLGGQRAALLNKNCILEEVALRNTFIRALLIEAQI